MHQLIQELKFFNEEELKYLNEKIDVMEFVGCPVGFTDADTGDARIEKSIRSSSGLYLQDDSEVANFIHERMNEVLLTYRDNLINEHEIFLDLKKLLNNNFKKNL